MLGMRPRCAASPATRGTATAPRGVVARGSECVSFAGLSNPSFGDALDARPVYILGDGCSSACDGVRWLLVPAQHWTKKTIAKSRFSDRNCFGVRKRRP
jgi:hypothetical protein